VPPGTSTAAYVAVRASDGTVFFTLPGNDKYGFVLPAIAMAPDTTVVEFHQAAGDRYFITDNASEIAALDTGVIPGWTRTGESFRAWAATDAPIPNGSAVCRFLGQLGAHFFSASAPECNAVLALYGAAWLLESTNVFEVVLPDATTGGCPVGTIPVYRLFSDRPDNEHRYTTSLTIRAQMIAAGWIAEGYGPIGVVMCVRV
jgi:hypothetical protein